MDRSARPTKGFSKAARHASSARYSLGKFVSAWTSAPATLSQRSEKFECMHCLPGVRPRNEPFSSVAKFATTSWPPGLSSAARFERMRVQSLRARSPNAFFVAGSAVQAEWSASGMSAGHDVSQWNAVAEKLRSMDSGAKQLS